jgi:hypothetical protein
VKIERATAADYPEILALNESALPHVNRISADDLTSTAEAYFSAFAVNGSYPIWRQPTTGRCVHPIFGW